jgi:hypothetical protein
MVIFHGYVSLAEGNHMSTIVVPTTNHGSMDVVEGVLSIMWFNGHMTDMDI